MGHRPDASSADDLCVLNDVRFFDLATKRWQAPDPHFDLLAAAAATADPVIANSNDAALENASEPSHQHHLSAVSPTTPADALNALSATPAGPSSISPKLSTSSPNLNGTTPPAYASAQTNQGHAFIPRARYAHLSSISASRLVIVGGQDLTRSCLVSSAL